MRRLGVVSGLRDEYWGGLSGIRSQGVGGGSERGAGGQAVRGLGMISGPREEDWGAGPE